MQLRTSYTADEFAALIAREDEIERKTGLGNDPIQEALVAISNSAGGVIFIGVTDDSRVVGRRHDQHVDEKIHAAATNARDIGRYRIFEIDVGGVPVVAIQVDRREEGFAQTSNGRILVRRGGSNVALFGADLARFINERALRRFEQTETEIPFAVIDGSLLREVSDAFEWSGRERDLEPRLREHGLLTPTSRLTIAGALFLTDPAISLKQSKAVIEVRRYPELSKEYDRREEFRGPLHHQVREATRFLVDELGKDLVVTGLYRHELPRLPEVVIREALANATAHRSYEEHRTPIIVELHADRVSVTSPGRLPEPVTVDNLRQAQAARNHYVIAVLRRFRLAEDAGRGIDVMQDTMAEALLDPPVFTEEDYAVRVVLPLRGPITARERAWVADLERRGEIRPSDRLLLVHAARGERLTNGRAREVLSVGHIEARQALQRLRDAGLIQQHGSHGGAHYSLTEEIAPPAAFRMSPREIEGLILDQAREGPITNEVVRHLTGLSREGALTLLSRLVREERLIKLGQKRGTRYIAGNLKSVIHGTQPQQ